MGLYAKPNRPRQVLPVMAAVPGSCIPRVTKDTYPNCRKTFLAAFPADRPELTVLISVDEPPAGTGDRFGGTAAAPVFAELAPTLIHERGIQPSPGSTGCVE